MRRVSKVSVILLVLAVAGWGVFAEAVESGNVGDGGVRRSVLQGSWYPSDPGALRRLVRAHLDNAGEPGARGRIRALVVPHAGYRYSGPVAAHAYRLIQGRAFKRVVLIGPSHRLRFDGVSVGRYEAYETPLGRVAVDRAFVDRLMASSPDIGFVPEAHAGEHSLEIQLPFLQTVLDDVRIVPVIMGRQDPAVCSSLAEALAKAVEKETGTLIVASTDLSHYYDDATARALDRTFIRHVKAFDPEGLAGALAEGRCKACGGGPAVTALMAARRLGAGRSVILDYANSGDVSGDRSRVVGYLSAAVLD